MQQESGSSSEHVVERFHKAMLTTHRRLGSLISQKLDNDLTGPQCFILSMISKEQNITVSHLADKMEVKPSAITVMLDRLVNNGYAERIHDSKDRRVVLVKCTEKGHEALLRVKGDIEALLKHHLKELDVNELLRFVETFEKIAAELSKDNTEPRTD
ncbi:MarR family winged helix-turn-helix transcriptional regulator [Paenibacillus prosopidis]|uniref:DNA-binding MarR family transcriptional regulator n=1 Tax=Paenibacillus prosopidis TaxID=630520 RepID=A0A368VWF6_9BACL|nr:MarR family transcriptional regulator [Paenibacillus prosopidis]RCW45587.1 DNA-binding MarR family transcriptional regulator [Paenibacillus prosopidis]